MKIVDRLTFLAMPAGTVYAKWSEQPADGSFTNLNYEEVAIKWDTVVAGADFVTQDLFPSFDGVSGSETLFDVFQSMLAGETSPPVDYDCAGRDGLFDKDQLFAVWSIEDTEKLVALLQEALATRRNGENVGK